MLVLSYGTRQSQTADFASTAVWNSTLNYSICFLNVSPVTVNAKLTKPSYVHHIFFVFGDVHPCLGTE